MDLPGAGYFYTLAQVGITFAGFAAILMSLRESIRLFFEEESEG